MNNRYIDMIAYDIGGATPAMLKNTAEDPKMVAFTYLRRDPKSLNNMEKQRLSAALLKLLKEIHDENKK